MEIVIFEMFLFNEITGFFSKTGEKNGTFSPRAYIRNVILGWRAGLYGNKGV